MPSSESDVLYDVTVDNGKYRFVYYGDGRTPMAFRHGVPWSARIDSMAGDKALLSLVAEIAELRQREPLIATEEPVLFNDDKTAILVNARVEVKVDCLTNAIIGVLDAGASNDWLNGYEYVQSDVYRAIADLKDGPAYADEQFWIKGGSMSLTHDDPEKEEGEQKVTTFGLADFADALATMALAAPRHFADLQQENDDAATHDVLLQFVCFGEIVYG